MHYFYYKVTWKRFILFLLIKGGKYSCLWMEYRIRVSKDRIGHITCKVIILLSHQEKDTWYGYRSCGLHTYPYLVYFAIISICQYMAHWDTMGNLNDATKRYGCAIRWRVKSMGYAPHNNWHKIRESQRRILSFKLA